MNRISLIIDRWLFVFTILVYFLLFVTLVVGALSALAFLVAIPLYGFLHWPITTTACFIVLSIILIIRDRKNGYLVLRKIGDPNFVEVEPVIKKGMKNDKCRK